MDDLWGPRGPDLVAQRRAQQLFAGLDHESSVLVLVCWALWDGTGIAAVADLLSLTGANLCALGELLQHGADGPPGIDAWLTRWSHTASVAAA